MLRYPKKRWLYSFFTLLFFPLSGVLANGDYTSKPEYIVIKKHNKPKQYASREALCEEACKVKKPRPKLKTHRHVKKHHRTRVTVIEELPQKIIITKTCKENCRCPKNCPPGYECQNPADCNKNKCLGDLTNCECFPKKKIVCEVINPSDIVDFGCNEFPDKIKTCEPYTCQAPSAQDPSIKTTWQIVGKSKERCIVSSTTEDLGFKDRIGNVIPITQTCEYDPIGTKGLIKRFMDMEKGYYHFSTCEHFYGIHNCSFTSEGQSLNQAMSNRAE